MDEQKAVNKLALLCQMLWQECITETDLRKSAKYARLTHVITGALVLLADNGRASIRYRYNGEKFRVTVTSASELVQAIESHEDIIGVKKC